MELLLVNTAIVGLFILIYVTAIFLLSQIRSDNSIMDIAYGPAFLVGIGCTIYATNNFNLLPIIICAVIGLWSIRLSGRILKKNFGKPEDERYAKWRRKWTEKGEAYFLIRSFLQINVLQGLIILVVSTPAILALTYANHYSLLFLIFGLTVSAVGLIYETVADWQLDKFIARKKANIELAVIMKQGLFKYSRRPNYFGETLVWWGLAIVALPLPYGWIGLISPLLITYIVTKVTGPMLEKIFLEKYPEEYGKYIAQTAYFIPQKPKNTV